jgi:hypothetical protein
MVPPGWTWTPGDITCDYDRACDGMDDEVVIGDGYGTWTVSVGLGRALVLDGEASTTAVAWETGLVLVRGAEIDSADDARKLVESVGSADWHRSPHVIDIESGCLCVFDAAFPGALAVGAVEPDGGVLLVAVAPGSYHVHYAAPAQLAGGRTTLIRLVGPR